MLFERCKRNTNNAAGREENKENEKRDALEEEKKEEGEEKRIDTRAVFDEGVF